MSACTFVMEPDRRSITTSTLLADLAFDQDPSAALSSADSKILPSQGTRYAMLAPGSWHTMTIDVRGQNFTAFLDGQECFEQLQTSL